MTTSECSFRVKLFDDASTRSKLKVMDPLDAMFDDGRNDIPDEFFDIVGGVSPGDTLEITVRRLEERRR